MHAEKYLPPTPTQAQPPTPVNLQEADQEHMPFSPETNEQSPRFPLLFLSTLLVLALTSGWLWWNWQQEPRPFGLSFQNSAIRPEVAPVPSPIDTLAAEPQIFTNQEFGLTFTVPQNYTVHDRLLTQDNFTTEHHYFGYALLENSAEGNSQSTDAASIKISLAKKNYTHYPGALRDVTYGQMQGYVVPFTQGEGDYSHELTILNFKGKELTVMHTLNQADVGVVEQILQSLEVQQKYSGLSQTKLANGLTQYTVGDNLFSFSLPAEWQVLKFRELEESTQDLLSSDDLPRKLNAGELLLTGPEGEVSVLIGDGFGGGCEQKNRVELTFMGEVREETCHFTDPHGQETWRNFGAQLKPGVGLSLLATTVVPAAENRGTVLEILGTFSR